MRNEKGVRDWKWLRGWGQVKELFHFFVEWLENHCLGAKTCRFHTPGQRTTSEHLWRKTISFQMVWASFWSGYWDMFRQPLPVLNGLSFRREPICEKKYWIDVGDPLEVRDDQVQTMCQTPNVFERGVISTKFLSDQTIQDGNRATDSPDHVWPHQ